MSLVLLDKMLERVNRYGADSDSALFSELLYAGEFIVKLSAAALIASIEDDRENHRYRLLYDIVRADGVGDWPGFISIQVTRCAHLKSLKLVFNGSLTTFTAGVWWQSLMSGLKFTNGR